MASSSLKPYEMKRLSMAPCLLPGDILLVDPQREVSTLKRGEILVFRNPSEPISTVHRCLGRDASSGLGLKTKGDRNEAFDAHEDGVAYEGVAVYRVRKGKKTKLQFGWFYAILSEHHLFPGQRVPSWLSKTNLFRWSRS